MDSFMGMTVNNPDVQNPIEQALAAVSKCGPSPQFDAVKQKLEEALLWLKAAERGDAFDTNYPARR